MKVRAADLFCGAGGTSTGLTLAAKKMGVNLDLLAVNHWQVAVDTHSRNHPDFRHLCADLATVDPAKAVPEGRLHLLVASPECFTSEALVLTTTGLVPIGSVEVGDLVLTHKNRWRPVIHVMTKFARTTIVKGHGHYGLETTAEHPFWARLRKRHWPKKNRNGIWKFTDPQWVKAGDLKEKWWGTPASIPELPVQMDDLPTPTAGWWWVVGRWLGDGCVDVRPGRGGSVTIACGNHEAVGLLKILETLAPDETWKSRKTRTATLIECRNRRWAEWLKRHFGSLAYAKSIPTWVYGMPREWRVALLKGYVSADGHNTGRQVQCNTVSKFLAIGVRLLASSLGFHTSIHLVRARQGVKIEGRKVEVRDYYSVRWLEKPKRAWATSIDNTVWSRVSSVKPTNSTEKVYNLEVEEDNSYVVDGLVVHNCQHHSIARGGRPKKDQSRASAWHVLHWAERLYIDWILIENVKEFQSWGPLNKRGKVIKARRGETFRMFVEALKSLGYTVEWRVLNAANYGDPTTRERLFLIARRGRGPIPWPKQTHFQDSEKRGWRPAREIIDWDIEGQSIFGRKRPLAKATLARIAEGLRRFGGEAAEPFLMLLTHGGRLHGLGKPVPTVTGAHRGELGLVQPDPYLVRLRGTKKSQIKGSAKTVEKPVPTISGGGGHMGVVQPFVLKTSHKGGNGKYVRPVGRPLYAVTTAQKEIGVVEPVILPQNKSNRPRSASKQPLGTITTTSRGIGLAQAFLVPFFGERKGQAPRTHDVGKPVPAVTSHGAGGLVEPFVITPGGTNLRKGRSVKKPLPTVMTKDRFGVVEPKAFILPHRQFKQMDVDSVDRPVRTVTAQNGDDNALVQPKAFLVSVAHGEGLRRRTHDPERPLPTVTGSNERAVIQPVMVKYNRTGKPVPVSKPVPTVTTKDRIGLVMTEQGPVQLDIRFRMLQPHELAAAMGFPKDYQFAGNRTDVVRQIGNAVAVNTARALCRAILQEATKSQRKSQPRKRRAA